MLNSPSIDSNFHAGAAKSWATGIGRSLLSKLKRDRPIKHRTLGTTIMLETKCFARRATSSRLKRIVGIHFSFFVTLDAVMDMIPHE
jgi:hypothetical protein